MLWWLCALLTVVVATHARPTLPSGLGQLVMVAELDPGTEDRPADGTPRGEAQRVHRVEEIMPVKQLNPTHYPARRAAVVAHHFLNTCHASPYKYFLLEQVHKATKEEVEGVGVKYNVEFSVKEVVSNKSVGLCSAEVLFPHGGQQPAPQVQCSCDGLSAINTTDQEGALYQKLSSANGLLIGNDIPDSHGHIAPDMKPIWMLSCAASSFIMLKESNESTLFSVAQLANVTQQESENDQLMFRFHVLLHELVSQVHRRKLCPLWVAPHWR